MEMAVQVCMPFGALEHMFVFSLICIINLTFSSMISFFFLSYTWQRPSPLHGYKFHYHGSDYYDILVGTHSSHVGLKFGPVIGYWGLLYFSYT
jgi:hypothetical protein